METRIHEVVRGIGDEQVRKYYAQDFGGRLRELLMPAPARSIAAPQQRYGGASRSYGGANGRPGPFERRPRFGGGGAREPAPAAGARLSSASPMVRGFRSALPPREALMLVATINHPWLLDSHIEEFAELEFINPDADRLRRVIVEVGTGHGHLESETLREAIEARGLSPGAGARGGCHHPPVGLAGAPRRVHRRRRAMVDPRCYLASQEAYVK